MNEIIELRNVTFSYSEEDARPALNNVSLTIQQGEWIAIIGPNGSGKSTLAKTINGLIEANSGEVIIEGVALNAETVWDVRKKIGMVFQNPDNQFVGSTVQDDVAFGLENVGIPREEMVKRVADAVAAVNMANFMDKEPARLSGGQKQRIALARALAVEPKLLLLDEPFGALDAKVRKELRAWLRSIHHELGVTSILVTHDQEEAAELSDEIVVMNQGQIVQIGDYETLVNHPSNHFVANFLQDSHVEYVI